LPTAKDLCLADLRRRILVTELVPGAELEETTLAADYNLSRTPLREVLQRLAGEGYVEIAENRGARVASMDITTMRTFFQTAPMIYANVGKLAAENRTEGQVETLEAAQSAFRDACDAGETRDMAMANHRFHAVTVDMAGNPYLAAAMDRLLINHTRMAISFYNTATENDAARVNTAIAQHEAMVAAIKARDGDRVVTLTQQHWDLSRDRMERFVRPDPLPLDFVAREAG